jgi:DNA oxidative demethylase
MPVKMAELAGFQYADAFLLAGEEQRLVHRFSSLAFGEVRMRGVAARRRVIHYGWNYSFETFRATEGAPIPEFLLPVRERAASFAQLDAESLAEALITEYTPGATIGWHRDAPPFGVVIGISLLAPCRLRFRRGRTGAWETTEIQLNPRSIYVLSGPARSGWQHSIPAVTQLRYSITFRTMKRGAAAARRAPTR